MATVSGACGLETCSNEPVPCTQGITQTSCGLHGCGGCGAFGEWGAYPHYNGCGSSPCNANTALPLINLGCGGTPELINSCAPTGESFITLDECGPDPGQVKVEPLCGRSETLIACVNPRAFAALCSNQCIPCDIGVHGVTIVF